MMGFLFIIATDETKSEKLMDQNYLKNEIVLLDFSILPESHDFPFQTKNKYLSFILSITYGLRLNIKQWSSLFPQFDTWYVLFKQIIWSLLLYSLILGQEGLGILQCHLGLLKYLSTNLRYLNFTWIFPFYVTLYSTTSQRQILYFLVHYICLTALVTFQITIFHPLLVLWKPRISRFGDFECFW